MVLHQGRKFKRTVRGATIIAQDTLSSPDIYVYQISLKYL